jgi:hypothetical protein
MGANEMLSKRPRMASFELRVPHSTRGANTIGSVFGIDVLYAGSKVNKRQMTLNHTLEFESDAETTGRLSKRNPVTDFVTLSRLPIFNFGWMEVSGPEQKKTLLTEMSLLDATPPDLRKGQSCKRSSMFTSCRAYASLRYSASSGNLLIK